MWCFMYINSWIDMLIVSGFRDNLTYNTKASVYDKLGIRLKNQLSNKFDH